MHFGHNESSCPTYAIAMEIFSWFSIKWTNDEHWFKKLYFYVYLLDIHLFNMFSFLISLFLVINTVQMWNFGSMILKIVHPAQCFTSFSTKKSLKDSESKWSQENPPKQNKQKNTIIWAQQNITRMNQFWLAKCHSCEIRNNIFLFHNLIVSCSCCKCTKFLSSCICIIFMGIYFLIHNLENGIVLFNLLCVLLFG